MSDKLLEIAGDSAVGGFSLFLGEAFSTIILAVGSVLIARLLGPDGYGVYTLAFVVPLLLVYLVELGVDEALIRFPAQSMAQGKETTALTIVKCGLKFKVLIASAGSIIIFLLSDVFASYLLRRPELGFYVKIASAAVILQAIFNSSVYAFIGLNRMTKSATLKAAMSIVRASAAPTLIILGLGVTGVIAGYLLGYLVAVILGVILLFTAFTGSLGTTDSDGERETPTIRTMVGYGFPIYLTTLLSVLVSQLQFAVLAYYSSNLEIGNFNAALNFTMLISVIVLPISLSMFPAFSKLNPINEIAELRKLFAGSAKYASLFILPASIGIIVLSKELVYVVYGASYHLAATFLSLYCVYFLYVGIGSMSMGSFFNGIGDTKFILEFGVINTILFFLAAPLLTPLYGAEGLIAAFLTSNLITLLSGLYVARRKYAVGVDLGAQARIYLAAALPALLCFAFLRLSPFNPLLNLVLGGIIFLSAYLTLVPVLGAVNMDDIQNLTLVFKRIRIAWPIMKHILAYEAELLIVSRRFRWPSPKA